MDETTTLVIENIKDKNEIEKQEYIEKLYDKGLLAEDVLNFLIDNEICISYLSHLPLSNEFLLKLFNKNQQLCAEAAFTIIDRILQKDTSIKDFDIMFSNCCNETVSEYLLTVILLTPNIDDALKNKYSNAIHYIRKRYKHSDELSKKTKEIESFIQLRFTTDIRYIEEYYKKDNYIYNIAISQNLNTPIEIINELCSLKKMKYSRVIRTNAIETKKKIIPK